MSDIETQKKTRGSRRTRWVLIVSLGLNLAVAGLVAGAALRGDHGRASGDARARAMQARDFGFGPYVAALDGADRRMIGRAFIGKAGRPDKARNEVQTQFESILEALKADPFDADALKSKMFTQLNNLAEMQKIGADVIVDHLSAMTPEARAAYAVRLDQALQRPLRHDDGRKGNDGRKFDERKADERKEGRSFK